LILSGIDNHYIAFIYILHGTKKLIKMQRIAMRKHFYQLYIRSRLFLSNFVGTNGLVIK